MLRLINLSLLFSLVVFAGFIYQVKYEARGVDSDLRKLEAEIEKEREALAVLRAEWSLLNRPDRIERLAKEHLSLEYAKAKQLISLDRLDQVLFPPAETQQAAVPQAKAQPAPAQTASISRPAAR